MRNFKLLFGLLAAAARENVFFLEHRRVSMRFSIFKSISEFEMVGCDVDRYNYLIPISYVNYLKIYKKLSKEGLDCGFQCRQFLDMLKFTKNNLRFFNYKINLENVFGSEKDEHAQLVYFLWEQLGSEKVFVFEKYLKDNLKMIKELIFEVGYE